MTQGRKTKPEFFDAIKRGEHKGVTPGKRGSKRNAAPESSQTTKARAPANFASSTCVYARVREEKEIGSMRNRNAEVVEEVMVLMERLRLAKMHEAKVRGRLLAATAACEQLTQELAALRARREHRGDSDRSARAHARA